MKWMMIVGGFTLFAVLATVGACSLILFLWPTRSSYGEAAAWLLASPIGVVSGFVGACSGYYVHKKEYVGAVAISVLLTFLIAIAIMAFLS